MKWKCLQLHNMSKYNNHNNFSRGPRSDPAMRFKNRPKYSANSSGGNNSPRYKYQNQSAYQFPSSRNSTADHLQQRLSEKNQRYFYGNSPNRNNYSPQQKRMSVKTSPPMSSGQSNQQIFTPNAVENTNYRMLRKQSSNFPHQPVPPPHISNFSPSTQNSNLTPESERTPVKTSPATSQSDQHEQIFTPNITENANYYGFPYNFYPSASNSALGVVDTLNLMWQSIKSTPPPKLPLQQPPLPQQQPPGLPPLPSPEIPPLLPPPPIPASITDSSIIDSTSTPTALENLDNTKSNLKDSGSKTVIKMKTKRKAMSARYKISKLWSEKDALLALKAEEASVKKVQKDFILLINFPDPEISREIVKNYSPDIESVHFHFNFEPRCCLIHLKPGTDVEKAINHLSKIPFGTGYLSVEIKQIPHKTHNTKLNEVDPSTLYVGNLPTTIAKKTLMEHFPGAARIDIGFSQRMKYTRYAFIRYPSVHQAIEAYTRMLDVEIGGRSLIIRFRRLTSPSEGIKDVDGDNNSDIHDDIVVSQATVAECEGGTNVLTRTDVDKSELGTAGGDENELAAAGGDENELAATNGEDAEAIASLVVKNKADNKLQKCLEDTTNRSGKEVLEGNQTLDNHLPAQENLMDADIEETNVSASMPLISNTEKESISHENQKNPIETILNVKYEPEVDPDDVVIRDTVPRCINNDFKQEQGNIALYEELFGRPQERNESFEISSISDRNSLASTTDEMDTISQLSSNTLGEFLQNCQRTKTQANNKVQNSEPAAKKRKITVKKEHFLTDNVGNRKNLLVSSKESVGCIKKELEESVGNQNNSVESINLSITNPSVYSSRQTSLNTTITEDSDIDNNDDIVPPTALFFTSDYHSKWANSKNNHDNEHFYDESYDTSFSSQATTSQVNVKTEPLDAQITNIINKRTQKHRISTAISNTGEIDDDLVPTHNLLGSYQPSENVIKEETEYDDIFSVPLTKNIQSAEGANDVSSTSETTSSNESDNVFPVPRSLETKSCDDDVVFISANIPPASKEKKSDSAVRSNLCNPRLTDLVTLNYKPLEVSIFSREVSTFLNRNNLDRLYDQLDADSDSDL